MDNFHKQTNFSDSAELIPVEKLINYRISAGRKAQKRGENNYPFPAWIKEDFTDPDFRFFHKVEQELEKEPILKFSGLGAEFASKTLISPKYIQTIEGRAKTARASRKARENYKDRVERSRVEKMSVSESLGNTANNFDKFEKPIREKRYRIQKFLQKNRIPGKQKCTCGKNHASVFDCPDCIKPGNRVCTCGQPIGDYITIKKNPDHGNINAAGVATCGSVWACPVCRAKIVNRRAKELNELYEKGKKLGWEFYLLTFTVPHEFKDNLAELYGSSQLRTGLSGAITRFRQSRVWSKDFKKSMEYIGDQRSVEITYGLKNGFHPHVHMIFFGKKNIPVKYWTEKFLKQWQKSCIKSGLGKPNEHGVQMDYVQSPEMVTYLSKWSVGAELSSDAAKKAKGRNYSIAALELMLVDERRRGVEGLSLERISGILRAYYSAMHGQKQLQAGGLNTGWEDLIYSDDLTDEQISSEELVDEKEFDILVLEKPLYQELKKDGVFNELMEALEPISRDCYQYKQLIYEKACGIVAHLGYDPWQVWTIDDFEREIQHCQG